MDEDIVVIKRTQQIPVVVERNVISVVALGQQGPPGIPGSPGAGYVHEQLSGATEWVINHNLGVRPAVAVMDTGGNELDADVVHFSLNQTRIYFAVATAGFARLT